MFGPLSSSDILRNLDIIAPDHKESIEQFIKAPTTLLCHEIRDSLFQSANDLDTKLICWQAAFIETQHVKENDIQWEEFNKIVAGKTTRQEHLRCILTVSNAWGKEIVKHYNWDSKGWHYCNKLHKIARKIPEWSDAVVWFNQAISEMIIRHSKDKRTPKVEGANSIQLWDLSRVIELLKTSSSTG